jgi:hypothetical protein
MPPPQAARHVRCGDGGDGGDARQPEEISPEGDTVRSTPGRLCLQGSRLPAKRAGSGLPLRRLWLLLLPEPRKTPTGKGSSHSCAGCLSSPFTGIAHCAPSALTHGSPQITRQARTNCPSLSARVGVTSGGQTHRPAVGEMILRLRKSSSSAILGKMATTHNRFAVSDLRTHGSQPRKSGGAPTSSARECGAGIPVAGRPFVEWGAACYAGASTVATLPSQRSIASVRPGRARGWERGADVLSAHWRCW